MADILDKAQLEALSKIENGNIVCGGVGSGKSRVGIAYYLKAAKNKKLYIITTAKKRDTLEWEGELIKFRIDPKEVKVDSWNNIKKYADISDSFFLFDEDRVTGSGTWVKAFIKIARVNQWIILSATPGDCYSDYGPVFVANGFYKNITEFRREHIIYNYRCNFPKIDRYVNTGRLNRLRNNILVDINYVKETEAHHIDLYSEFDLKLYKETIKTRWNSAKEEPIETANELCYELRRICNADISRAELLIDIVKEKQRVIIFYNFDYELEQIKQTLESIDWLYSEWNGHKHEQIPEGLEWAYVVQYNACEGWNCIKTDTIIFYSQTYSYKTLVQASGRIDRRNTPFRDLYYYHLKTRSSIDVAISKALHAKKKFNEKRFVEG